MLLVPVRGITGYAEGPWESAFPGLWTKLHGCWMPGLGMRGNRLWDFGLRKNHLTPHASTAWPTWQGGKRGTALFFNSSACVNTSAFGLGAANAACSLLCWVTLSSLASNRVMLCLSDGPGSFANLMELAYIASGQLFQMLRSSGGLVSTPSNSAAFTDRLFCVGYTWDGTTNKIYLNGTLSNSAAGAHDTGTMNYIGLGTSQGTASLWHGQILEAYWWGRALSAQEMYLMGTGASPLTLSWYVTTAKAFGVQSVLSRRGFGPRVGRRQVA